MGDGGRKREREKQGDKGGNEECKKGERKRVKKEGTSDFVSSPSVHKGTFHDLQARAALQSRNDGRCAYNSHHGSGRTD